MIADLPDGLHVHRLDENAGNPREVAFAEQWKKEHKHHDLLDELFMVPCSKDDPGRTSNWPDTFGFHKLPLGSPTERDRQVAATVVQWLGSNCGLDTVRQALERVGYGIKYPER